MAPPVVGRAVTDGVVTVRDFHVDDRPALLAGRDAQWARWLGPGSTDPTPTACIEVAGGVVGWLDADRDLPWLHAGEANLGYSVFAAHRQRGHATRAMRLLLPCLAASGVTTAVLVIDPGNVASLRLAAAVGARPLVDRHHPDEPEAIVHAIVTSRAAARPRR